MGRSGEVVRGIAGVMLLAGCGGGENTAPIPAPIHRGIRIVGGAGVTDSVASFLVAPLIVEVRDSAGRLAPVGTIVKFATPTNVETSQPEGLVAALNSSAYTQFAAGATDALGRAGVQVRLGERAGVVHVVASSAALGVQDTARFTAIPGATVRFVLEPSDTTVTMGRTVRLRGGQIDRFGNAHMDAISWSVSPTGVKVSRDGVISADSVEWHTIIARAGTGADTVAVRTVPSATILAIIGGPNEIFAIELDGTNRRVLTYANDGGIGVRPQWIPGTERIIYSNYSGLQELLVFDPATRTTTPFFSPRPPFMSHQAEAEPTRNGEWLFFAAYDERCGEFYCLFRARMDGSSPDLLGNIANAHGLSTQPSPSPDGRYVAYAFSGNTSVATTIGVMDMHTRSLLSLTVDGIRPQWSPDGKSIAFRTRGALQLAIVDVATGKVDTLTNAPVYRSADPFTWSSDGVWILSPARQSVPFLINVRTKKTLQLEYLGRITAAQWR